MPGIDLVPASLAAIVVESAAYGVFIVLFIGCLYALLHKRRRTKRNVQGDRNVNWTMLSMAVILFAAITCVSADCHIFKCAGLANKPYSTGSLILDVYF